MADGSTRKPKQGGAPRRAKSAPAAPIERARGLLTITKLQLAAASAGHCEFSGCTTYLYQHAVSGLDVNLGQNAHIYAFSEDGPRGTEADRPRHIDGIDNLMLLCPLCHHTIDTRATEFPVARLKQMKRAHEARIHAVASVGPDVGTCIIELKGNIGADFVSISQEQMLAAIAPRFPVGRDRVQIDLTKHADGPNLLALGIDEISAEVDRLMRLDAPRPHHVSVFGLASIPLLVHLGATIGDKIAVDLFQKHRDSGDWLWKSEDPTSTFGASELAVGTDPLRVAVVYSLSGHVSRSHLPTTIDNSYSVYELRLSSAEPNTGFLRTREDLSRLRAANRELMGRIKAKHEDLEEILVFPAIPAPFAIALGMDRHPKADPALRIHDYNKNRSGFDSILSI